MNDNIILIQSNKSLLVTKKRPIYQKENRADCIKFLISKDFMDNITDSTIILQVVLPNSPNDVGVTKGKLKYMKIEEELYKDKYVMSLPITTTLTNNYGTVQLWFIFFNTDNKELIKTSSTTINIIQSDYSMADIEDKEFPNIFEEISGRIDELEKTKLDKNIDYNPNENTLQFYCNGEPVETIKLDDDVQWTSWEN